MNDTNRAEFEAWVAANGGTTDRREQGDYRSQPTERAWEGWQAARSQPERVALSDREIEDLHWGGEMSNRDLSFARAILSAQADAGISASNSSQPMIAEAARDDRARGRAEALAIILTLCPETGLNDYLTWGDSGCSGESSASWSEEKLRELMHVDSELADMMDEAEAEYWHNLGLREEAERNAAKRDDMAGDAKRYQWLRDDTISIPEGQRSINVVMGRLPFREDQKDEDCSAAN